MTTTTEAWIACPFPHCGYYTTAPLVLRNLTPAALPWCPRCNMEQLVVQGTVETERDA